MVAPPSYLRGVVPNKLTPYHEVLEQALNTDAHRIKQNRRTSKALFAQIKVDGSLMLGPKETDVVTQVGLCILNQNLADSDKIAAATGLPLPLVNHAIDCLEGAGHMRASKLLAGTVLVHTIGPTLRRAFAN